MPTQSSMQVIEVIAAIIVIHTKEMSWAIRANSICYGIPWAIDDTVVGSGIYATVIGCASNANVFVILLSNRYHRKERQLAMWSMPMHSTDLLMNKQSVEESMKLWSVVPSVWLKSVASAMQRHLECSHVIPKKEVS